MKSASTNGNDSFSLFESLAISSARRSDLLDEVIKASSRIVVLLLGLTFDLDIGSVFLPSSVGAGCVS